LRALASGIEESCRHRGHDLAAAFDPKLSYGAEASRMNMAASKGIIASTRQLGGGYSNAKMRFQSFPLIELLREEAALFIQSDGQSGMFGLRAVH
jgi:hypothetical protein